PCPFARPPGSGVCLLLAAPYEVAKWKGKVCPTQNHEFVSASGFPRRAQDGISYSLRSLDERVAAAVGRGPYVSRFTGNSLAQPSRSPAGVEQFPARTGSPWRCDGYLAWLCSVVPGQGWRKFHRQKIGRHAGI